MTNRTAWTAGNGQGLTWGLLFAVTDYESLANGSCVRSTIADIANGSNLDMYMDISYLLSIASNTITSGANFSFWIYLLNQDGSTYGDNQLPTAGTAAAITPAFAPVASMGIPAVATTTNMYGYATGILLPPGSFRMAIQNNSGFTLNAAAGSMAIQYRTYNINLNN
jgi:hypothetical protein